MNRQDLLRTIEQFWDKQVADGCGYTLPALDLSRDLIDRFITGEVHHLPGMEEVLDIRDLLPGIDGKDVLCLASGGGQQSAVFSLCGARVTVVDICEGQLEADRVAARHYGYEVRTIKTSMDDLSTLADASFDLVSQAVSLCFAPDVRAVYREVHRVLRPGGCYDVSFSNPATAATALVGGQSGWDGIGYRIADRYQGGPILRNAAGRENMEEGEPIGEHVHLFRDTFGGLLELGFIIRKVAEASRHLQPVITGDPGTWQHAQHFVGWCINVMAEKSRSAGVPPA